MLMSSPHRMWANPSVVHHMDLHSEAVEVYWGILGGELTLVVAAFILLVEGDIVRPAQREELPDARAPSPRLPSGLL